MDELKLYIDPVQGLDSTSSYTVDSIRFDNGIQLKVSKDGRVMTPYFNGKVWLTLDNGREVEAQLKECTRIPTTMFEEGTKLDVAVIGHEELQHRWTNHDGYGAFVAV